MGPIGGHGFRKLATIGDTVNVAACIESADKDHGTQFPGSEVAVQAAELYLLWWLGFLAPLKGEIGLHRLCEVAAGGPDK